MSSTWNLWDLPQTLVPIGSTLTTLPRWPPFIQVDASVLGEGRLERRPSNTELRLLHLGVLHAY